MVYGNKVSVNQPSHCVEKQRNINNELSCDDSSDTHVGKQPSDCQISQNQKIEIWNAVKQPNSDNVKENNHNPVNKSADNRKSNSGADEHNKQGAEKSMDKIAGTQLLNNTLLHDSTERINTLSISVGFLNVCGLKRRMQYPEFCSFIQNYDIICLAETKLDASDVISLDGYTFYSQPRRQKYMRKSGGLGFLVRNNISNHVKVVETETEYISWLKLSKQFHKHEQDIMIASVYIPPQQSRFFSNDEFEVFEQEITSVCSQYDYIFVMGDFNAQTGDLEDFTSADTFLSEFFHFDPQTVDYYDQKCALERYGVQVTRTTQDKKKNNSGFRLVDICKNHNLTILNGRYGQDKNLGSMTFRNVSTIDYTMVSTESFKILQNFQIIDLDRIFSDGHSFLSTTITINPSCALKHQSKNRINKNAIYLNQSD